MPNHFLNSVMFNSVYRVLIRCRTLNPIQEKLCYVQINNFSSKPFSETTNHDPNMVNYLMNTFGFSQEKAFNASKYLKVESTEKPDLVVKFLEKRGFTADQIGSIARFFPPILLTNPERTLLPKIEFFLSLGISQPEVNNMFLTAPGIFKCSLKKHIIRNFSYVKSLFESSGTSFGFTDTTKRLAQILGSDFVSHLIPNVEILREAGVPVSKIVVLLQYQPRSLMVDTKRFKEVVEEVMKMNISPCQLSFIQGVQAFRALSKSTWDKKKECYKKWGWSEDDIISAFERDPKCMMISTNKITASMNFLVNEMGFSSSFLVEKPGILLYSLEKRIKPRCSVYKILLKNGLIKEGSYHIFNQSQEKFLKRFVLPYEEEVPGLLQLCQKELTDSES